MELMVQSLPIIYLLIALASLLLTLALGIILAYHLVRYALAPGVTSVAVLTYVVVSAFLLSGLFASFLAFTP